MRSSSVLPGVAARTAIVGALTITLTPALGVTWASACSCVGGTDRTHASRADAIFTGTLIDTNDNRNSRSSTDPVTYTFAVSRVYKGEVTAQQPVGSVVSGASCGLELDGTGPFLVFASKDAGADPVLSAGLCGGTRPVGAGIDPALGAGSEPTALPVVATGPAGDDDSQGALFALGGALGLVAAGGLVHELRRRHRRPTP